MTSVCLLLFIVASRFPRRQLENGSLPIGLDSYDALFFLRPRLNKRPLFPALSSSHSSRFEDPVLSLAFVFCDGSEQFKTSIFRQCFFVESASSPALIRLHLYHRSLKPKSCPRSHLNGPGVVLLVFVWLARIKLAAPLPWRSPACSPESRSALILFPFTLSRSCRSRWRQGRHAIHAADTPRSASSLKPLLRSEI